MKFTAIADIRDEIRPLVPGAPIPTVDRAIRRAAVDFCTGSTAIRETQSALTIVKDIAAIKAPTPGDTVALEIHEAKLNGTLLDISSPKDVHFNVDVTSSNTPTHIYLQDDGDIVLSPAPADTDPVSLIVNMSYAPTRAATSIPTTIVDIYFEVLYQGALAFLLDMDQSAWAQLVKARNHLAMFNAGIRRARARANHEHTPRRRTIKYGGI